MAGVEDFVWRNRYLLSPDVTPQLFTATGLRAALQNDLALLSSDLGAVAAQSLPGGGTTMVIDLPREAPRQD